MYRKRVDAEKEYNTHSVETDKNVTTKWKVNEKAMFSWCL